MFDQSIGEKQIMDRHVRLPLALLLALAFLAPTQVFAADDGLTTVYEKPIEVVRKASEDALALIGVMKLKKSEPELLEGQRSRKVGAFVGSGGEILTVMLKSVDAGRTELTVKTKKTFVGMAGQKNWNEPLTTEIGKLLAAPAPETTTAPVAETAPPAAEMPTATPAPQATTEPEKAP
jgi:hypothetical protein